MFTPAGQEPKVVRTTYWVAPGGGQTLGKEMSNKPAVVVVVSAVAKTVPVMLSNCELTNFEVPLLGVKRYPVLASTNCVQFLPGGVANFVLVSS